MDKINTADYLLVPGGEFIFGACESDYDSASEEWPRMKLNIPSFHIKRTVVTVKEWKVFLDDSHYEWDDWETVARTSPTENHPIVAVSWYDAHAYCTWGSRVLSQCMRLPNEFEWEKACRGNHGQLYPVEVDGKFDRKVYSWDEEIEAGGEFINRIVGRDPTRKSPYGCLDMWESVGEWCENWYHEFLDEIITLHNGSLEAVLADTEGVAYKVVRGGGYFDKGQPRCTVRGYNPAGFKHGFIGFRPALCSP